MNSVKKYSFNELSNLLLGKKINFVSDCEFFPNFNIICKVINMEIQNSEILFTVITYPNNKKLIIGSNMKNLRFSIV